MESFFTRKQAQQALVETALAYLYHNPWIQYEGQNLLPGIGWYRMVDTTYTAEEAGPDEFVYTVCSNFGARIYRDAMGWFYPSGAENLKGVITRVFADPPEDCGFCVYRYRGEHGETDPEKAKAALRELLQPGDLVTYFKPEGGHMMFYAGELNGDGKKYILHSTKDGGQRIDFKTGLRPHEPKGSIRQNNAEDLFGTVRGMTNLFADSVTAFAVTRPLNVLETPQGFRLTDAAASRLKYPHLEYRKYFSRPQFEDIRNGETVTCFLRITNNGNAPYENLPVTEPLPAGQELAACSGNGALSDGALHWNVNLAPGRSVLLRFTVRLNGKDGDFVLFPKGTVSAIPTRAVTFRLGGARLNGTQLAALSQIAAGVLPDCVSRFDGLETLRTFYRTVLGTELSIPTDTEEFLSVFCRRVSPDESPVYRTALRPHGEVPAPMLLARTQAEISARSLPLSRMLLHRHLTGRSIYTGEDMRARILEYEQERYLPGDFFVSALPEAGAGPYRTEDLLVQIVLPENMVLTLCPDGAYTDTFEKTVYRNIRYAFSFGFRPTMTENPD